MNKSTAYTIIKVGEHTWEQEINLSDLLQMIEEMIRIFEMDVKFYSPYLGKMIIQIKNQEIAAIYNDYEED